jgi:RHS repeat-associated protein
MTFHSFCPRLISKLNYSYDRISRVEVLLLLCQLRRGVEQQQPDRSADLLREKPGKPLQYHRGDERLASFCYQPLEPAFPLANGQKIAQRISQASSETLSYVHADHLGSSVKLTDETGQVIQTIAYDPYGESVLSEGAAEPAYQYTGQEKDAETGLYYYGARYYDAELGRFIQADVLLDGLNRYSYSHNNPLKYVDPTGNYTIEGCEGPWCDTDFDDAGEGWRVGLNADGSKSDWRQDVEAAWNFYQQVVSNYVGESWQGDNFNYETEGLDLALEYIIASGGQSLDTEFSYNQHLSLTPNQGIVMSLGWTGGIRLFGVGPVTRISLDLVIASTGAAQLYLTQSQSAGYWGEGLLNGNENVIKLAKHMTSFEKIPQGDSFMLAGGCSFTVGIITSTRYDSDNDSYHPFYVDDYEGLAQTIEGDALIFTASKTIAFDPDIGPNGQWQDLEVTSGGLSFLGLPGGLGHYTTESSPWGEPFYIPGF